MEPIEDESTIILINKRLQEMPTIPEETKKLDIRRNKIEKIVLCQESQLEYLDISDNQIMDISSVSGLKHLKYLDMGYNLIKKIPRLDLPVVEELYLMANDIKMIENIDFATLKKIDMANNDITELSGLKCPQLVEVFFGANKITKVEDLTHLTKLKVLDLQFNDLKEFDCKILPQTIETLLLNNNKELRRVKNISLLKSLKLLGIKNTKVEIHEVSEDVEIW